MEQRRDLTQRLTGFNRGDDISSGGWAGMISLKRSLAAWKRKVSKDSAA